MNARKRKKWQKKYGTYINPKECWDLYRTMAEFILPRLKQFKKDTMGYPGFGEMDTEEKWDIALDKMIQAFEYIIAGDNWWLYNPKYDYTNGLYVEFEPLEDGLSNKVIMKEEDWVAEIRENHKKEEMRRNQVIEEGLQLFAKWYMHLWW